MVHSVLGFFADKKIAWEENKKTKLAFKHRDEIILSDFNRKTDKQVVNIHYWKPNETTDNLGDYLSKVVINHYAPKTTFQNVPEGGR